MMKRILALLTALMLLLSMAALAEESVYDLIENALYRIVLRTEEGDEPLGTGVLFSDKKLLLTSAACAAQGQLIAIGQDGEHAVSACEAVDQSGAALLELAEPASGTPLNLAAEDASGMAALFGAAEDGETIVAPLNHVQSGIFRGQSALLLSSSDGLLPGSIVSDEKGNLIGLCIAQQTEGQGSYIALDANGLYRALSRQQYADAFLPAQASWENGELTISWTDEERGGGLYIVTLSGDDNQYYIFFEAKHDERSITLTVPPEHRYDYQVQWAESEEKAIDPVWASMTETFIPGFAFSQYGYTQTCGIVTRKDVRSALMDVPQPTLEIMTDRSLMRYLQVKAAYDVSDKTELPMTIEILAPDGQFYFESAIHTFTTHKEKEDTFLLPLDGLLADCAEFSGGVLQTGEYVLRYALGGGTAGEYAFTLTAEVPQTEPAPDQEAEKPQGPVSGFVTDLTADYKDGCISLTWAADALPEEAYVTAYFMYEGNNFYMYQQMKPGENQMELFNVPGRHTLIWATWALDPYAEQRMPQKESDFMIVPAAPETPFTLNGFQNQRLSLVPSDDPHAVNRSEYLPEVTLTREILTDKETPVYFQTEDTYQVETMSDDHPMMLVLCTPEGLCFVNPLMYIFDPALQTSDTWLTDISAVCRDYENFVCGAWPAGEYRLMYCIDGQIAGEYCFTLE